MKILNLHKAVTVSQVVKLLKEKLNPLFQQQRQSEISFSVKEHDGAAEISQPEFYAGVLFRIEPVGTELNITRSENYVDDVNSLTLESIMETLFDDLSGPDEVSLIREG